MLLFLHVGMCEKIKVYNAVVPLNVGMCEKIKVYNVVVTLCWYV